MDHTGTVLVSGGTEKVSFHFSLVVIWIISNVLKSCVNCALSWTVELFLMILFLYLLEVVRVWDPRTGSKTIKLRGNTDNIRALLLDSNGRFGVEFFLSNFVMFLHVVSTDIEFSYVYITVMLGGYCENWILCFRQNNRKREREVNIRFHGKKKKKKEKLKLRWYHIYSNSTW